MTRVMRLFFFKKILVLELWLLVKREFYPYGQIYGWGTVFSEIQFLVDAATHVNTLILQVIELFGTQLPVSTLSHILAPESILNLSKLSHSEEVRDFIF